LNEPPNDLSRNIRIAELFDSQNLALNSKCMIFNSAQQWNAYLSRVQSDTTGKTAHQMSVLPSTTYDIWRPTGDPSVGRYSSTFVPFVVQYEFGDGLGLLCGMKGVNDSVR
jgi:hypothetical protein